MAEAEEAIRVANEERARAISEAEERVRQAAEQAERAIAEAERRASQAAEQAQRERDEAIAEAARKINDLEGEKEKLSEALGQLQAVVSKNDLHKEQEIGPFIADIVVMEANKLNETKREALDKMKGEEVEGIWGSIRGNQKVVGEYKEEGLGAMVGYTREVNEGVRIMPILNVSKENGRESTVEKSNERGSGEREEIGIGLATGIELNGMNIKAIILGERGEVKTSRTQTNEQAGAPEKECKAKGEYSTLGAAFGVGAEYRVKLGKKMELIPELGFTAMSIKREKYEEDGGANALRLEGMNYAKSVVNTGVNVEVKEKKYKMKAGVGVDVIVSGEKGKASGYGRTEFYGTKDPVGLEYKEANRVKVESVSTDQGQVIGTANIGAEYALNKRVNVGIEVSGEKGKNSQSVSGKVNAKYDLGRKRYYGRSLRVAKNNIMRVLKEKKGYVQEELEKKKEELARAKSK
jgi:hypothetical protein